MDRTANRSYTAGRNEPCPCGSGRKFKRCHGDVRPSPPTDEERAELLAIRLDRHAARRLTFTFRLAKRAGLLEDDQWWVASGELAQPFLRSVTWFAGGVLADHLTTRGPLLGDEDRALEEAWADAELGVGEATSDSRVELADGRVLDVLGTGGAFVLPRGASVGWVVPVGGQPRFLFGVTVGADVVTATEAFAGTARDPDAIAAALGEVWLRRPARSDVC